MIVSQMALGRVRSNAGSFIFTERMGEKRFLGIDIFKILRLGGAWVYSTPETVEVVGDCLIYEFPQAREVSILVDDDYINSQLREAEWQEQTWEEYQEMVETLAEMEL